MRFLHRNPLPIFGNGLRQRAPNLPYQKTYSTKKLEHRVLADKTIESFLASSAFELGMVETMPDIVPLYTVLKTPEFSGVFNIVTFSNARARSFTK